MNLLNHSSDGKATIVRPFCGMFVTMVEYKDRLQLAMTESGVSVSKLADELGASYQAVKKAVDGNSGAFSAPNNAKAARFLGVSSDWLALGIGPMRMDTSWPFTLIDEVKFRALPQRERDRIEAALVAIAHGIHIDVTPDMPTSISTGS